MKDICKDKFILIRMLAEEIIEEAEHYEIEGKAREVLYIIKGVD